MALNPYIAVLTGIILPFCQSCNDATPDFSERLEIAMVGTFFQPAGATGTLDPKSMIFTLDNASLQITDGGTLDLFKDQEPKQFRIISRSQIILEANLSNYKTQEIKEIKINFEPTVEGVGQYSSNIPTNLTDSKLVYATPITIQSGKTIRLDVTVQWKNTISLDSETTPPLESLSPPQLVITKK